MQFARVLGTVVCTEKVRSWRAQRLLLLEACDSSGGAIGGRPFVGVDLVSAATGQLVFVVRGREAAVALEDPENPADAAIVGLVDAVREAPLPGGAPGAPGR